MGACQLQRPQLWLASPGLRGSNCAPSPLSKCPAQLAAFVALQKDEEEEAFDWFGRCAAALCQACGGGGDEAEQVERVTGAAALQAQHEAELHALHAYVERLDVGWEGGGSSIVPRALPWAAQFASLLKGRLHKGVCVCMMGKALQLLWT